MANNKDNAKLVASFLGNMDKKFGKENNVLVKDLSNINIEKFPTGSLDLDIKTEGGYPRGKLIEVFGENQSGKTTLAVHAVKEHQKKYEGDPILWVDLEDVYDNEYMSSIGVDITNNFILAKPLTGEDAWNLMIEFTKQFQDGGLIVLDSVALLLPSKESEGEVGDAQMGAAARMNSQGLRKIFPHLGKNKITFLAINQTRSKIGVMFGDPITTTGGKGWEFYARTRIKMSKSKGEAEVFSVHKMKLIKATYGRTDSTAIGNIVYGIGIDKLYDIINIGTELGVITKSGSWFSYGETKLGQGASSVRDILEDNIELTEELECKIKDILINSHE